MHYLPLLWAVSAIVGLTACGTTAHKSQIHVTQGQPQHWTLDDAHYLLAEMHQNARSINITKPAELDPNSFHRSRIQQIQSTISASIAVDELAGIQTKQAVERLEQNNQAVRDDRVRAQELREQRDELRNQLVDLAAERAQLDNALAVENARLEFLRSERTRLEVQAKAAGSELPQALTDMIAGNQAAINTQQESVALALANQAEKQAVTEATNLRLSFIETELTGLVNESLGTVTLSEVAAPEFANAEQTEGAVRDDLAEELVAALRQDDRFKSGMIPSLNVADQLSNYIGAEYTSLARKLTLLREELGADRTLVFLEMPHSIHTAAKVSNNRHVQVEWQVAEVCTHVPPTNSDELVDLHKLSAVVEQWKGTNTQSKRTQSDTYGLDLPSLLTEDGRRVIRADWFKSLLSDLREQRSTHTAEDGFVDVEGLIKEIEYEIVTHARRSWTDSSHYLEEACRGSHKLEPIDESLAEDSHHPVAWNLIPSVDAYNIADFDIRDREHNVSFWISRAIGLGAGARIARRQQQFEQFATQDVFGSGYGVGQSTFGWVLSPKPGADRVSSGPLTTFAALIVPSNTTALRFNVGSCILANADVLASPITAESDVCKYDRTEHKSLLIRKNREFWVEKIDYGQVKAGELATVIVRGHSFSPFQLSVLVNGIPLQSFTHGTRPTIAGTTGFGGYFEVLNEETVKLVIRAPQEFVGNPEIAFVTPQKTSTLNFLPVRLGVEGGKVRNLYATKRKIFVRAPQITTITATHRNNNTFAIRIEGSGFEGAALNVGRGTLDDQSVVQTPTSIHFDVSADRGRDEIVVELQKRYAGGILSEQRSLKLARKQSPKVLVESVEVLSSTPESDGVFDVELIIHGQAFTSSSELVRVIGNKGSIQPTLVSSSLIHADLSTASDKVLLRVLGKVTAAVEIPKTPVVLAISNEKYDVACGRKEGGEVVRVQGVYLDKVASLRFGSAQAQLIEQSVNSLRAVTPPGEGKVTVVATSKLSVQDQTLTSLATDRGGIVFTYSKTSCKERPFES